MSDEVVYEPHPLADIFPAMSDESYKTLVNDIKTYGLRSPIILAKDDADDGKMKVLDGRNRLRACAEAGVLPHFEDWDSKGSPIDYVVSTNLVRRHLNASQRAALGQKIEHMKSLEIKAEQKAKRSKTKAETESTEPDNGQPSEPRDAAKEAAAIVGVSKAYVATAKRIGKHSPKTLQAIQRGEKTISQAQKELGLDKPKRTRKEAASDATDDEWLIGLPLSSKLEGVPLKTFQEDASAYRASDAARQTFHDAIADVITNAKRKGAYVTRLRQLVNTSPPEKWKVCPEGDASCGGSGKVGPDGQQCAYCNGRGYSIK